MTLLAAFETLLWRYSGQTEISIGTPIAGRTRSEMEDLIGHFTNTLVLRGDLSGSPKFSELLSDTRRTALGAYAHQALPFEKLVDELQPERDLSRTPLFQAMFVLQNAPISKFELSGLTLEPLEIDGGVARFDLLLLMEENEQGLAGWLEYNTDIYEKRTMERMLGHYGVLLESIAANPGERIGRLKMLSEEERAQLVVEWNRTEKKYEERETITELFERQAAESRDREAVVSGEESISYGELNRRANRLARYLRQRGVGAEECVGVRMSRGIDLVVGLMGVLKSGGGYVPLDPAYPEERVRYMLEDSGAGVVISDRAGAAAVGGEGREVVVLDEEWEEIAKESGEELERKSNKANLAYVIYTSGSTGKPKGVGIEHGSAVKFLQWAREEYGEEGMRSVMWSTSVCFDLSIWEIFGPLSVGGRVLAAENALAVEGVRRKEEIEVIDTVPSAMSELVRMGGGPSGVKGVNVAGEALSRKRADDVYGVEGIERLYNLYGPSEDTTYSTYEVVRRGSEEKVTIGKPIANTRVYILDEEQGVAPIGVGGELYIGGAGLARGYVGKGELTGEKFVPDPYSEKEGERLYRTGDVCRWGADGRIEYVGRADSQVKVRGYRIELGEVEERVGREGGGKDAAVVGRGEGSEKRLVGYVVVEEGVEEGERRRGRKEKLPEYMVPGVIVKLEKLPLTPNGKVDRKALPAPDAVRLQAGKAFTPPRTKTEIALAEIWSRILRTSQIGVDDNFFELGGDSILAIQVISNARRAGLNFTPKELFQHQTIGELAKVVKQASGAIDSESPPDRAGRFDLVGVGAKTLERLAAKGEVKDIYPLTPMQQGT